ncbi:chloride channel protein [Kitasatospora sp. NBC_01539]|uniref:chloride channel protein n=1 Tax=Kitasatospora sp. NBC_01539 TaxID=2903577 RepID=UPI0038602758
MPDGPGGRPETAAKDPYALVRTRGYVIVLVVAAVLGVPVSAAAFGFLALVSELQSLVYTDLPKGLGFDGTPSWWAVPLLAIAGLLVALTIRHLPGTAGHKPAEGLVATGQTRPVDLPGIALAALTTLSLGAVLGPEAPLIALGSGLAIGAVRLAKRDFPKEGAEVVGVAGSFAAVSTLLGSPLIGAFLLMEASGIGGAMLGMVLVPGLLAAGIGALIFTGLGSWTGLGTYSLGLGDVPHASRPDLAGFGWALVIGIAAALVGTAIHRVALVLQDRVDRRRVVGTVLAGVVVGLIALVYAEGTGNDISEVLYSGQDQLAPLISASTGYSAVTLAVLTACKALAYAVTMSGFRGGPVFPALFAGAAGGLALSHLPGLGTTAGLAMGIGAMCVAMLKLPLTSVLLATLLIGSDGVTVVPLVIVAVVVSYVLVLRLTPKPVAARAEQPA